MADELPAPNDVYLRLQSATVFVRDQDAGIAFYVGKLGFRVAFDVVLPSERRIVAINPPAGDAMIVMVAPPADSPEYALIGTATHLSFITENIEATFKAWSEHGVHFHNPPQLQSWGGNVTLFEDPDGNTFGLMGIDQMTRQIEAERRAKADRQEAERDALHEMEIARQVQSKLFPQIFPVLTSIEYAGQCIQARNVGGDYYDFLDLGEGRLGLVMADIAGKGIAGALLMANLQANLRSQSAIAMDHPQRMLQLVNRLFYQNTTDNAYATLFFAEYCDHTRQMRYANCGHLPGMLLRGDGTLEMLESNSTVLGLFEDWPCTIAECQMHPGDTLLLYTDGLTEAVNSDGEEFGEDRLAAALKHSAGLPAQELLASIVEEVQQFSTGPQQDDLSLIVARCR